MGYNTVAFVLNDLMSDIERSPKTAAWLLSHPPMGSSDPEQRAFKYYHSQLPKDFGEPTLHSQALEVLPTFHADEQHFFVAGGNCIQQLQPVAYGVTKEGKKTVTLELPDWFEPGWYAMPRGARGLPRNWPKKGK